MSNQTSLPKLPEFPPQTRKPPWRFRRFVRGLRSLRNPKRIKKWGQLASFLAGLASVYGTTLPQLVSVTWILIPILVLSVLVGFVFILVPADELDVYRGKPAVDWAWDEMLRSAKESIEIVAGNLSWLNDDRKLLEILLAHHARGCKLQVICDGPEISFEIRTRIAMLLEMGVEVRVLPPHLRPLLYSGFVIDRARPEMCTAFRNRKKQGEGELGGKEDNYVYWGKRYLVVRDSEQMAMWLPLVSEYWERSSPVTVLEPLPDDQATRALVIEALRQVDLYSTLKDADVQQAVEVEVGSLFSWCLREDKNASLAPVLYQMDKQGVAMFEPCVCWTNKDQTVLLPPIVERHGDKLVVVEGTHRLWHRYRTNPTSLAKVLVVANRGPLPGKPVPFSEMRIIPGRLGKADRPKVFRDYDDQYWRSFRPMERFLKRVSRERLAARTGRSTAALVSNESAVSANLAAQQQVPSGAAASRQRG